MTPPYVVAFIGPSGLTFVDVLDDIDDANRKARELAAKFPCTRYLVYALKHVHGATAPASN